MWTAYVGALQARWGRVGASMAACAALGAALCATMGWDLGGLWAWALVGMACALAVGLTWPLGSALRQPRGGAVPISRTQASALAGLVARRQWRRRLIGVGAGVLIGAVLFVGGTGLYNLAAGSAAHRPPPPQAAALAAEPEHAPAPVPEPVITIGDHILIRVSDRGALDD